MGAIPIIDRLTSFVANLGTGRDKLATVTYGLPLWDDLDLITRYRVSWVARKIVDIPALDSFRKWRDWQAEDDQITLIEAEEQRLSLREKLLDAKIRARLFGGAALYIGTMDADQMEPLRVEAMGLQGIQYLTVLSRRDLTAGPTDRDPASEWYGKPSYYQLSRGVTADPLRIHPSRLVILLGTPLPDTELAGGMALGWGDSVLVSTMSAIEQADSTAANVASLVFEAKVDVIKIEDLMDRVGDRDQENRLLERFSLAALAKSNNGMLMLDRNEEYEQKTASFGTLPEIIDRFMQLVSGAADIPMTRFLGRSPGGLNATGESDMKNYHDRISAIQQVEITPAMARLDECLIRSALGTRPPEVHFRWAPLEQMSEKEQADIGAQQATMIEKLNATGLFPPEALANAAKNMLVESGVMPGLDQAIDEAGGLPDYEAELEAERQTQIEAAAAKAKPASVR